VNEPHLTAVSDDEDNSHRPEPRKGTWTRKSDGQSVSLLGAGNYPVQAECLYCGKTVEAESYWKAFAHVEDETPSTD